MGRGEEHAARSRKRDLVQNGGHVRLRHVPDLLCPIRLVLIIAAFLLILAGVSSWRC